MNPLCSVPFPLSLSWSRSRLRLHFKSPDTQVYQADSVQGPPSVMLPFFTPQCVHGLLLPFAASGESTMLPRQNSPTLCPMCPETLGSSDLPLVAEADGTGLSSQANHQVSCSPGGRATRRKELPKPYGLHRTRNHTSVGSQGHGGLSTRQLLIRFLKRNNPHLEVGSSYNEPHI